MAPTIPAEFDGYEVRSLLGRGAMGEVYLAHDTLLDRPVAIKFIRTTERGAEARERFLIEARAIARLQHPNVVGVYRVGKENGIPYLVSEYVDGRSLDRVPHPISVETARAIAMDVASGMATAHRRGVVHRDIKPANVILTEDGTAKLLDFGIAKLLEPRTELAVASSRARDERGAADAASEDDDRTSKHAPLAELHGTIRLDRAEPTESTACVPRMASTVQTRVEGRGQAGGTPRVDGKSVGLTRTGATIGTPRYMAPEVLRGETATFRSDIYSFGALLFKLCAGQHAHPAKNQRELRERVLEHAAPSLRDVAPHIDAGLAKIVDRCLQRDAAARFASGSELRAAVAEIMPDARHPDVCKGNPYRGLQAFEVQHRDLYFGRDSETRMVLQRLAAEPFVLVVGDSGVGKSSLCRAGILSRVDEWLGDRLWTTVAFVPGKHPVTALSAALAPVLKLDEAQIALRVRTDPGGLARELRAWRGDGHGIVVFVDQLEELVTWSEPGEASVVAELLGWLAVRAPGARLLATVRADFLSGVADLPRLGDEVARALYFLRPLTDERLRDAVVRPVAIRGGGFGTEAVIEELVTSTVRAGRGGLPLLQFTLAELWDARGPNDTISDATLEKVGGVAGALSRHADSVLEGLTTAERCAARSILTRLVTAGGTRARKLEAELRVDSEVGRSADQASEGWSSAIKALVRGRLVVASDTTEGVAYEIAHEALLGAWPTLASWLSDDVEQRRMAERLGAAQQEWVRLGCPKDALWGPRQLAELATLPGVPLGEREQRFVLASKRWRRLRLLSRVALVMLLPLIVIGAYAATQWRAREARHASVSAELEVANRRVAEARELQRKAGGLRERALQLFDRREREAGEGAWGAYLATVDELELSYGRASQQLETALLMDLSRADTRDTFADVLYEQALLSELLHERRRTGELLGRLSVYDDGQRRRARWQAPAHVTLALQPSSATAKLSRYVLEPDQSYREEPMDPGDVVSGGQSLSPGSYVATLSAAGYATIRFPFAVTRGERTAYEVELPPAPAIPEGFAYVPPGRFLFGSAADERQRRDFLHTVPRHPVHTQGFLIARRETTFGDWLEYLDSLPPEERIERAPRVGKGGFKGALELIEVDDGGWQMTFQPTDTEYSARVGETIAYRGRASHAEQDWTRMPVVGITVADAERYARWLDASGRVPGARLCKGHEWERAARGADGRVYPHGERLAPEQANHDATYGKKAEAMGPDEVGSHPQSRSPFGLEDMAGNVWEWTVSSLDGRGHAARGGSWYFGPNSSRATGREETEASFRDVSVGMRVCADLRRSSAFAPHSRVAHEPRRNGAPN